LSLHVNGVLVVGEGVHCVLHARSGTPERDAHHAERVVGLPCVMIEDGDEQASLVELLQRRAQPQEWQLR
jgi:hypothetical protein